MDKEELYTLLAEEELEISHIPRLRKIVDQYPCFQAPLYLYLKSVYLFDGKSFREELEKYSVFIQDRKALFFYILKEEYSKFFAISEKKTLAEDRTNILLNAFFETKGTQIEEDFEYNLSHTTLASSDYLFYIDYVSDRKSVVREDVALSNCLKHQNIIDSFIEKADEGIKMQLDVKGSVAVPVVLDSDKGEEDLSDDLFFTETLSKIYIKQQKYEKAYKIIKHLSLNYPKKNTYFADQLSFLEKLIINSKFEYKK